MHRALSLHKTTVGQKAIMAITGVMLFGFAIAHLLGNLQIFLEPIAMAKYAAGLRSLGGLLWVARIGLLVAVLGHVWAALQLMSRNTDARPVAYQHGRNNLVTTYAARTMRVSGPILFFYIVFHLGHLTMGRLSVHAFDAQHPYNNVVLGFQVPWLALVYIVANLMLGMHLFHGAWSWFQSLGLNHPRYNAMRKTFAGLIAGFITAGNVLIPTAALTGMIEPAERTWCFEELEKTPGECQAFYDNNPQFRPSH